MARKSKFTVKARKCGYVATKSGRVLARFPSRNDCELFLRGFTGLDQLPPSYQRVGHFYA